MVDIITYPNRRIGLLCWREKVHIFRGQSTGKFQIIWSTDYGPMMAISQNIFWLGLKSKVFCGEKQQNNGNLGQGNESDKNSSVKNTQNTKVVPEGWAVIVL